MASASMTPAAKAAKLREMAKDKSLPQDVRNTYLDEANKLEEKAAKGAGVKLAKGGDVNMSRFEIDRAFHAQKEAAKAQRLANPPVKHARNPAPVKKTRRMSDAPPAKAGPPSRGAVTPLPAPVPPVKKMMYGGMAEKPMMAKGGMAKELPKRGQRTATNMAKGGSVAKKGKK
jgi:hypothetical protein